MYVSRGISELNALKLELILSTTHQAEQGLIDSGATENFIDPRTIERLRLPTCKLGQKRTIYNIDGTNNKAGSITHVCQLRLTWADQEKTGNFYVTDLGQDRVVLGFPFLQDFNPKIDWEHKKIIPRGPLMIKPKSIWHHRRKLHLDMI